MKTITIEIPDGKKAEWVNGVLTWVDDKPQEPNEQIPTFADAVRYLGMEEGNYHSILDAVLENNEFKKKIEAYAKLLTIATVWNRMDGFVADCRDEERQKWFPFFEVKEEKMRCMGAVYETYEPLLFSFKTENRAEQFGKQFVDLWNDLLK